MSSEQLSTEQRLSRGTVSPIHDFKARGDREADDSEALAKAFATGFPVDLSGGDYKATNLLAAGTEDLIMTGSGTIWFPRAEPALTFAPTLGTRMNVIEFATSSILLASTCPSLASRSRRGARLEGQRPRFPLGHQDRLGRAHGGGCGSW